MFYEAPTIISFYVQNNRSYTILRGRDGDGSNNLDFRKLLSTSEPHVRSTEKYSRFFLNVCQTFITTGVRERHDAPTGR